MCQGTRALNASVSVVSCDRDGLEVWDNGSQWELSVPVVGVFGKFRK